MAWSLEAEYLENRNCDVVELGVDDELGLSFDNTGKHGHYRALSWSA
jgi:hypothetical protein